jgi:hypothetical protein
MDKERKAAISNDLEDETELKEDLEGFEDIKTVWIQSKNGSIFQFG